MQEIEIGRAKRGRRAYSFDDIAIVPSRRTRDPEEVSRRLADRRLPLRAPDHRRADGLGDVAADRDRVRQARRPGRAQPRGPLDPVRRPDRPARPRSPSSTGSAATAPDAGDLRRADQARADHRPPPGDAGRPASPSPGSLSPQRTKEFAKTVVDAGVDMFVIRGTTVSAEHVSAQAEPLNLKEFIYELDVPVIVGGCATYQAALHLMRTGAAGVLVGFGGGAAHTTRHGARHRGADGHARSPTSPPRAATTWTSPAAATSTSSPTAPSAAPATSPRPSPAAPTR